MAVDPIFAQWLIADGFWLVAEDAPGLARWGTTGASVERMTCLAFRADADAESARHLSFLRGPLVLEEHLLRGEWRRYRGQVITLTAAKLGYDQGIDVFVLGADDNRATGLSTVTVLRRLT